jgi:outer membrane protein, heavy metal efflux system
MYKMVITAIGFVCISGFLPLKAQDSQILDLDLLISEALAQNPQLQAARNRAAAAKTRIKQASAWEAPQIGVDFYQTPVQSFPNPVKDGMETDYFIQQMIPFPGKLSAMGEVSRHSAAMLEQDIRITERKIIRELKTAYYELYLLQQKILINRENQSLMQKFIAGALKQYEGGMGNQSDILRAQTEFSLLLNEETILHSELQSVEAMIHTLLNHPVYTPLGSVAEIRPDSISWTAEQLQSLAFTNRPDLIAMNYNIDMNKADLVSSRREYYPDVMARLMYKNMTDTEHDFWSLMIGMDIPLAFWSGNKFKYKAEENRLKVAEAEDQLQTMKNMVSYEIRNTLLTLQTRYGSLNMYRKTLVPQSEQTLQSTLAAYQTGKTEFLMVLDAYRMLLMARQEYHMSLMNYMVSRAQLEQAVGLEITAIAQQIHKD